MRNWLPLVLLVIAAGAVLAMPWRRPDPHHEFILSLVSHLEEDCAEPKHQSTVEVQELGHRTAAGHSHDPGGADI